MSRRIVIEIEEPILKTAAIITGMSGFFAELKGYLNNPTSEHVERLRQYGVRIFEEAK